MARDGKNDEGFGFLFPVSPEKRVENGPRLTGKATLNGLEVEVAAWSKTSAKGDKYFSLKFQGHENSAAAAAPDAGDDDIPFD